LGGACDKPLALPITCCANFYCSTKRRDGLTSAFLANCPNFIAKDQRPPNLPNLNPWTIIYRAMLEVYHKQHPKSKTIIRLKKICSQSWKSLHQEPIDKAVKEFPKRLKAMCCSWGGHFEHSR